MEYVTLASVAAYFWYFYPTSHKKSTLFEHGYIVIPPTDDVEKTVYRILGRNYEFLDYKYTIQGTALPTFHRDVTSGQRYCGTKLATYTAIQYDFDGDFLSICPNSHWHYPFTLTKPHNISGKKNTVVLFNSDVLHAGMPNKVGEKRIAHQYKIVYNNDLQHMNHLQGIRVIKKEEGLNPWLTWFLRQCSFHGAWFVSIALPSCLQRRHKRGIIHYLQNLVPLSFYNNKGD